MFFIGIPLDDYRAGFYSANVIAEEYINMPEKPPVNMPNGKYGLEEYFELRIATACICGTSMKEAFKTRPQYMKGHWDGFINFVRAFRHFKVKTMGELERKVMEYVDEHRKEQEQQRDDIHDADWWKKGKDGKKPWEN